MKNLILLVFAFAIMACTPRPNDNDVNTTDDQTRPMTDREVNPQGLDNDDMTDGIDPDQSMDADMDMAGTDAQVQQTMDAVQGAGGDITSLAPSTAVSNIDSWINELEGMDGTDGIVTNLRSLKDELGAASIDGPRVSNLLSELATETRQVGGGNQGLTMLASALDAGAAKLGGK